MPEKTDVGKILFSLWKICDIVDMCMQTVSESDRIWRV